MYNATTHDALRDEFYAFLECWFIQFAAGSISPSQPPESWPFLRVNPELGGSLYEPSLSIYEDRFANNFTYYHSEGTDWVRLNMNVDWLTSIVDSYHLTNSSGTDYRYTVDLSYLGAANSALSTSGTHSGFMADYPGVDETYGAYNEEGTLRWKATQTGIYAGTAEIWYTPVSGDEKYWSISFDFSEAGRTPDDTAREVDGWLDDVQLDNLSKSYSADGWGGVYNPDGSYQGNVIQWNHDYEVCYAIQDGVYKITPNDPTNPTNMLGNRRVLFDKGSNIDLAAGSPHFGKWVTYGGSYAQIWANRTQCFTAFPFPRFPGAGGNTRGAAMQCRIGCNGDGYHIGYFTREQEAGSKSSGGYPGSTGSGWHWSGITDCNNTLGLCPDNFIFKSGDIIFAFGVAWVGAECRMSYYYFDEIAGEAIGYEDGLPHCTCFIGLYGESVCISCQPTMN